MGLLINWGVSLWKALIANQVQKRFEVEVKELPEQIEVSTYSMLPLITPANTDISPQMLPKKTHRMFFSPPKYENLKNQSTPSGQIYVPNFSNKKQMRKQARYIIY